MLDKKQLLKMYQNKISKGETFEEVKSHIINHQGEEIFKELEKSILSIFKQREEYQEKNKKYFMLLCNTKEWKENTKYYEVNKLLYELNEDQLEPWKINGKTLHQKMPKGSLGIIKVGNDTRTIEERTDEDGNISPLLESGIYGIFEVVGEKTYYHDNECFVDIKVINNLYKNNRIISKQDAIKLLGEVTYTTKSSKKIEKFQFDRIINFIES